MSPQAEHAVAAPQRLWPRRHDAGPHRGGIPLGGKSGDDGRPVAHPFGKSSPISR